MDGLYFSGVVISKNIVDFVQGIRMTVAVGVITNVKGFMGMHVIKVEHAARCRRHIYCPEGQGGKKKPAAACVPIFKNCRRLQSMFQYLLIFRKNDKIWWKHPV